ncbi:hypothetical protein AB0C21_40145 [Spirillospora sp. NPDC049024]
MNRLRKAAHSPLVQWLTRLATPGVTPCACGGSVSEPFLARAFSHPQGAGVIGPGTQRLLRTVLVDALARSTEGCEVVISRADLERLFGAASSQLSSYLAPALHITDTLEDAIEHLENRAPHTTATGSVEQPQVLWLATPGDDADVVHQTLEREPSTDLMTLLNGPWPYGPTHFVTVDGPQHPPCRNLDLLTRDQAIARLWALG